MSSISGPISPADGTTVALPFDLTVPGVSPATAQVEARGDNGLLLPATENPKQAVAGSVTFQNITSLVGTRGAAYAGVSTVISSGSSFGIASTAVADKNWSTTRTLTLPTLTLTSGQNAALILTWEDEVVGATVSFSGLGFTPTLKTARPATPAVQGEIYWCTPGAGTYNGSITISGTGNCDIHATWVVFDAGNVNAGTTTGVDVGGAGSSRATMPITTTGTGSIVIGGIGWAESGHSACTPNSVAAGDTDDCSVIGTEDFTDSAHSHLRINGTVNAGTHNIGVRLPLSAVWSIYALEILPA